jgi:hypothetical protein
VDSLAIPAESARTARPVRLCNKLKRVPTDLLARLEAWKTRFGAPDLRKLHQLLIDISGHCFPDADSLIRLHECLLFLRAYPADAEVLRLADAALFSFAQRVAGLRDLSAFEDAAVSGIAGTSFSAVFSYEVATQLTRAIRAISRSIGKTTSRRTSSAPCCGASCRWSQRIGRWKRTSRSARGWMPRARQGRAPWAGCSGASPGYPSARATGGSLRLPGTAAAVAHRPARQPLADAPAGAQAVLPPQTAVAARRSRFRAELQARRCP